MVRDYSGGQTDGFTGSADDDLTRDVNDELRARIKGELEPGERVLWAGWSSPPLAPPGLGSYFVGAVSLVLLVFGAISCAHAVGRPRALPDENSMALGIVLCIVGILFSSGLIASFFVRRNARRRGAGVSYAVTDRRVIIWTPEPNSDGIRILTMSGAQIRNIVRVQRLDGSGDLELFSTGQEISYFYHSGPGFKHIPEVRRVEQIIRNNLMTEVNGSQVGRDQSEFVGDIR
jgi:hypothetical protein